MSQVSDETVALYEHYFRDPKVGDGNLQPPSWGLACRNIRRALSLLGYPIAESNSYDEELTQTVRRFQTDRGHTYRDGIFGRGTRRLLTRVLLELSERIFERGFVSPEYAVFFSYARKDEAAILPIVEGLQEEGIPIFRDKDAIPPGASWPDVLFRSIQQCQVFVCVLTPHSAPSVNVLIEVALARHAHKPIVPVVREGVALPEALHLLIGTVQHLSWPNGTSPAEMLEPILRALARYGLSPP